MKFNKHFSLLFCFIFCQINLILAQTDSSENRIIYLNDGSVLIGEVIEDSPLQIVLVGTTGDTLHISKNFTRDRIKKIKATKFHFTNGPFASFDFSVLNNYEGSQIDLLLGYRMNEQYAVGLGVGSHTAHSDFQGISYYNSFKPVYAYGRRYFASKRNTKAFLFMKAGYGFTGNTDYNSWWGWRTINRYSYKGGPYAQPGIGVNFASRNKFRMILSLSQYFQYTSGVEQTTDALSNQVEVNYTGIHSQFTIKLGIEFR